MWLQLAGGYSVGVGKLWRGRRGFFVLGRKTLPSRLRLGLRAIIASGIIVDGVVKILDGALSADAVSEIEQRLRGETAKHE